MVNRVQRWPQTLWSELEELVPKQKRSAFVRDAVEQAIKREKRKRQEGAE